MDGTFIADLSVVLEQHNYKLINLFVTPETGEISILVKRGETNEY